MRPAYLPTDCDHLLLAIQGTELLQRFPAVSPSEVGIAVSPTGTPVAAIANLGLTPAPGTPTRLAGAIAFEPDGMPRFLLTILGDDQPLCTRSFAPDLAQWVFDAREGLAAVYPGDQGVELFRGLPEWTAATELFVACVGEWQRRRGKGH